MTKNNKYIVRIAVEYFANAILELSVETHSEKDASAMAVAYLNNGEHKNKVNELGADFLELTDIAFRDSCEDYIQSVSKGEA